MGLDILNPVELKKINNTGTMGVIPASEMNPDIHQYVDPFIWGIIDNDSFSTLDGVYYPYKDSTGVFVGDVFYVYGGEDGYYNQASIFYVYRVSDTATGAGTWHHMGFSNHSRKEACMDTDGSNLYVYGGSHGGTYAVPSNTLQKFTIIDQTTGDGNWSELYPGGTLPSEATRHDICIYDGYLYTIGGCYSEIASNGYDQFFRYSITSNQWEQLNSPGIGMIDMMILPWNNKIYCFGGVKDLTYYRQHETVLIYDIDTNTWTDSGIYCPFPGSEQGAYVFDDVAYLHQNVGFNGIGYSIVLTFDFNRNLFSYRFMGGRIHMESSVAGHPVTGDMYMFGHPYSGIHTMWKRNDMTLVIRKI